LTTFLVKIDEQRNNGTTKLQSSLKPILLPFTQVAKEVASGIDVLPETGLSGTQATPKYFQHEPNLLCEAQAPSTWSVQKYPDYNSAGCCAAFCTDC
jgi:hypothetical protein